MTLPASLSFNVNVTGPSVTITPGPASPPPGLPPYPLASDPGQVWDLEEVNGVPSWVQFTAPPGQTAFALEDAYGGLLLEDGAGYLLMEA